MLGVVYIPRFPLLWHNLHKPAATMALFYPQDMNTDEDRPVRVRQHTTVLSHMLRLLPLTVLNVIPIVQCKCAAILQVSSALLLHHECLGRNPS